MPVYRHRITDHEITVAYEHHCYVRAGWDLIVAPPKAAPQSPAEPVSPAPAEADAPAKSQSKEN